jgi:hypothetical protein
MQGLGLLVWAVCPVVGEGLVSPGHEIDTDAGEVGGQELP